MVSICLVSRYEEWNPILENLLFNERIELIILGIILFIISYSFLFYKTVRLTFYKF